MDSAAEVRAAPGPRREDIRPGCLKTYFFKSTFSNLFFSRLPMLVRSCDRRLGISLFLKSRSRRAGERSILPKKKPQVCPNLHGRYMDPFPSAALRVSGSGPQAKPLRDFRKKRSDHPITDGRALFEDLVHLPRADRVLGEGKGAMVAHLLGGAKEGAKSGAIEGAADANTLHSNRREFRQAQLNALQSHHDIHRATHRADHGGNVVPGGEAGGIENIGAGILKRLQPLDRIFEVWPAVQGVFRARSQREGKGQGPCCCDRCANAFYRAIDFVDGMVGTPGGIFY